MKRKVIAVTGGIGSGKSEVCAILRDLGWKTVDCDQLARQVADDPTVISEVANLLGSQYVTNGVIDRKKVRETVFNNSEILQKYNAIFFERIRDRLSEIVAQTAGTLFVEIAVIDAFDFPFDEIWLVECDEQTRIERVTARDKVSAENVLGIVSNQHYGDGYALAIINNGDLAYLRQQVLDALYR